MNETSRPPSGSTSRADRARREQGRPSRPSDHEHRDTDATPQLALRDVRERAVDVASVIHASANSAKCQSCGIALATVMRPYTSSKSVMIGSACARAAPRSSSGEAMDALPPCAWAGRCGSAGASRRVGAAGAPATTGAPPGAGSRIAARARRVSRIRRTAAARDRGRSCAPVPQRPPVASARGILPQFLGQREHEVFFGGAHLLDVLVAGAGNSSSTSCTSTSGTPTRRS